MIIQRFLLPVICLGAGFIYTILDHVCEHWITVAFSVSSCSLYDYRIVEDVYESGPRDVLS